jgi:transposase
MGMRPIPQATVIALTIEERKALEALAGSRKSEARMRDRARIVLLAASGTGSRAVAREVGCTPGTASKWRVRFACQRMPGLSETGDRGAERRYGPEHGRRILAMLDQAPPAGYSNWTAPLLARELVAIHEHISGVSFGLRRSICRVASRGVRARTPNSFRRRRKLLAFI